MDYSLITEQAINNRYNTVPDELRDAVDSEQTRKIITDISKTQYLDENKSLMLEQLVALVLLGFMSTSELVHELREELFLNHEHARVLANELNNRIFESLKEELVAAYNPPAAALREPATERGATEPETAEAPMPISSFKIVAEETPAPAATAAPAPIRPIAIDIKEGEPAMLQKQTPFFERAELKSTGKKPALSFNTFSSSSENTEPPRVQAKIETPLGVPWAVKKEAPKEMKKVVHYNEFGSSAGSSHSGPVSEFINLEALKKVSLDAKPVAVTPQPAPAAPLQQPISPDIPTLITPVTPKAPVSVMAATAPKPIASEEKKSPLMWGISPLSVSVPNPVTPPVPSAPVIPAAPSAAAVEPKRMDAIVSNADPSSAPRAPITASSATSNSAAQPALDGNIIHLR